MYSTNRGSPLKWPSGLTAALAHPLPLWALPRSHYASPLLQLGLVKLLVSIRLKTVEEISLKAPPKESPLLYMQLCLSLR